MSSSVMYKYDRENEFGNIEYKEKLLDKSKERIDRLMSQMRYRCNEGDGECMYILGVSDDGTPTGLTDDEFTESFNNLSMAASSNNYSMSIITTKTIPIINKKIYELLIRENNEQKYIDIKVAVAGNVDAGKSTLIGTLISGHHDDGNGLSRLLVFNFKHEVKNGRTSSVAHHILGFDTKGNITNYNISNKSDKKTWPEIVKASAKIISFYDLCGHEKYLKTTITGLTSAFPDLCLIIVGANMGISRMTQEHIFLCVTLKIPFVIIITKIDYVSDKKNVLEKTLESVSKLLRLPGLRKIPYTISNIDDVITCAKNIHAESIVPIFQLSSVTGEGLDYLKKFLNFSNKSLANTRTDNKDTVEYHIDATFSVPGFDTIVGGQLISGNIKIGDKLLLGPNNETYEQVQVRSIHCKRVPMQSISYGSYVCIGLKKINRSSIHKGNVIISLNSPQISVKEFDANITVLKTNSMTIKNGYTPMINTNNIRQTAELISIQQINDGKDEKDEKDEKVLHTGDKAIVKFMFKYHTEYIKPGMQLVMSEGKVKIIGTVLKIY